MISASCAELLDEWCRSLAARCPHSTNELLARKDSSATSSQVMWRCYAPRTLDNARKHYARGAEFCTRHQQLQHLLDTCMLNARPLAATVSAQDAALNPSLITEQQVPTAATPECRSRLQASSDKRTIVALPSSSSPELTSPPSSVLSLSLLSSATTSESEGSCSAQAQQENLETHSYVTHLQADANHEFTHTDSAEAGSTFEPALASPLSPVQLVGSFPDEIVTLPAFDIGSWSPSARREMLRLNAWRVGCVDTPEDHTLVNATRNVSRRKAFLRRQGLACFGNCVRAVVDAFASKEETESLRVAVEPTPPANQQASISVWRWAPPDSPAIFGVLVARAQAVFSDYLGVDNLRFYRANVITWLGRLPMEATTSRTDAARAWRNNALHGDTNTDEMFMYTAILYLTTYGVDCEGGETGIADAVDAASSTHVRAGLRVQPSRGRQLLFSAGVENMHEMLPVTRGKRVAMQMWFACDGQLPGWAHAQRVEWERKYGYGGPDNEAPTQGKVPDYTSAQLSTKAWEWREPAGHLPQASAS